MDVKARGFWDRMQCAFFDIRVFYPRSAQLSTAYTKHESEKRRVYGQRVRDIEHGSFSPLVFSSTGGMGKEAKIVTRICKEKHPVLKNDELDSLQALFLAPAIITSLYSWHTFTHPRCNKEQ